MTWNVEKSIISVQKSYLFFSPKIAFFIVLNIFLVQKWIFTHFWNSKKCVFVLLKMSKSVFLYFWKYKKMGSTKEEETGQFLRIFSCFLLFSWARFRGCQPPAHCHLCKQRAIWVSKKLFVYIFQQILSFLKFIYTQKCRNISA